MAKHTILCVDDEVGIVDALERIFRSKYNVLKATSGKQALEILDQHPDTITVIITDQRMPNMTGVEFLSKSIETHPLAIRILLTGFTDIQSVVAAINSGQVYRYVTKPWDPVDLSAAVDRAVERFELSQALNERNKELAQALEELKTLDKAKNDFMILVNHELKTPLTGIMSFTELLKESSLDEDQRIYVNRIQKSSERLKHLVDDTMVIIGSEAKTLKVKTTPFTCLDLGKKIRPDILNELLRKNLNLDILWTEKKVIGDIDLVAAVLSRLLHNCAKFANEGSSVNLHTRMTGPHRVEFSVANEGPGIPEDILEKIFKPFYINENIMNHASGTGLGLTVCQALLKSMQSSLKVANSQSGVISSFELACL